jgi:hypothetical protein
MAIYALVENNEITEISDGLPQNWRNISNFSALENNIPYLNSLGWQQVQQVIPTYDTSTERLENWQYKLVNGQVILEPDVVPFVAPTPEEIAAEEAAQMAAQWIAVRQDRDHRMNTFEWRYTRYFRQQRLGITPTTDQIENLDSYMQALANITQQSDPFNIVWPTYVGA